jgi:methyltransferase-like protein
MRFHTRTVQDPDERARQAVAVCQLIANSLEKPDAFRQLFKEQLEQIQRYRMGHLLHDDLAEVNDPVYFHQFAAQAAEHQLQYVGEADFFEMQDDTFTPEARQIFARMEDSRLTREQYLDFVKCRRFRQTLLCRCEAPLRYPADSSAIERFHISSQAEVKVTGTNLDGTPIERFSHPRGGALEVGHPLGIRVLHHLVQRSPATISFADLFAAASVEGSADQDKARGQLRDILLEAYRAGVVEFRRTPLGCLPEPSERPMVSRFARWQLTRAQTVTTLRGENLRVEDEIGKRLFLLLDGTRTFNDLEQSLAVEHDPNNGNGNLHKRIQELARLALLEA